MGTEKKKIVGWIEIMDTARKWFHAEGSETHDYAALDAEIARLRAIHGFMRVRGVASFEREEKAGG
jgi:hypothetical protein